MKPNRRNLLISQSHKRLQRLWQFLFAGWGLVLIAALIAGGMLTRNLRWLPISGINLADITQNQFKMTNPAFSGIDNQGNPFKIKADIARQEYDSPDFIFMDNVRATIMHVDSGKKITDNITANRGKYDKVQKNVTLTGNVRVVSSNGDVLNTNEMVIKL